MDQVACRIKMISGARGARFGFRQIAGVRIHPQHHVAGVIPQFGIRMRCNVVEQFHDTFHCAFRWFELLCSKSAGGLEEGDIDGLCVKRQGAEDFLNVCFVGGVEKRRDVGVRRVLHFGAIVGLIPDVWRIFGPCGFCVLKPLEGPLDVARHGNCDVAVDVVPREGETQYRVPVQSSFTLYPTSASLCIRYSASVRWVYLTPKSSTTKVKYTSLVSCFQSPGVTGTGR